MVGGAPRRLSRCENLAGRIEHVSVEQGDGAGFDIRSFDDTGDDLFIEMKTTRFRKETAFFISANEVRFSEANSSRYAFYRVDKEPGLFTLPGNIAKHCQLTPSNYRGAFPRV
ncbi:MAG: DUF3883 domain-containing protein [Verrucomicrobiales bacterium]